MALSSPGIGSGLDVAGLITQLMSLERRPLAALDTKEAGLQARLSAFGSLKGSLAALQTAAQALKNPTSFSARKATVADATILSANAGTTAATASYSIEVQNLAQSQKLRSAGFVTGATVVGTGTITFDFGTYTAGVFAPNAEKPSQSVTIDSSKNTLAGIRDAINTANAGVTASIINDGTANRLMISANDTGVANALKVSVADDDANHIDAIGLSQLAYNASTGGTMNLSETVIARNATLIIDGVTISKASNIVTDAIDGVTLTLTKANLGTSTNLTIALDSSGMKSTIEAFIKAYNDASKALADVSAYNAETKKSSVLSGDSTVRGVQSQLRGVLNTPVIGTPTGLSRLSDIGIAFQKNGTLSVDSAKLQAALDDPTKDVSALFASSASTTGYAAQIDTLVTNILASDGMIVGRTDGINRSIRDIGKQREVMGVRLEGIEKRLRTQYSALDTMLSNMQRTSTYLQQQLSALQQQ